MHSQVFKCYNKLDLLEFSPFAVKVTREDDEEKTILIKEEYNITKVLSHKNIIRSYEMFEN